MAISFVAEGYSNKRIPEVPYKKRNFSDFKIILDLNAQDDPAVIYLVQFSRGDICVDERAPESYRERAALHEAICMGGKHLHLVNIEPNMKPEFRCCRIEMSLFYGGIYGTNKQELVEYARQRLMMFEFLLKYKLNPSNESLGHTALSLKAFIEKNRYQV